MLLSTGLVSLEKDPSPSCVPCWPFQRSVGSLSLIYLLSVERFAPVFLCACCPQVGVFQVEFAELNLRRGMCLSVQEGPGDLRVQCSFCGFLHPPFLAPGITPLLSISAVLRAGSLPLILDRLPMLSSLLHLPSQLCVGVSNVSWVEFRSPSCSCLQLIFDKRRGWKVCSAI